MNRLTPLPFYTTVCKLHVNTQGEMTSQNPVTIRPPFCGYDMTQYVELMGEDLPCYLNEM